MKTVHEGGKRSDEHKKEGDQTIKVSYINDIAFRLILVPCIWHYHSPWLPE